MNPTNDFERRMADYYAAEAPPRAPDWVLTQTLETIDTTPQRWSGLRAARSGLPSLGLRRLSLALGGAVAVVAIAALALNVYSNQPAVGGPSPSDDPRSSFLGTWYSTSDADGGTQTMAVRASGEDGVEVVVTDTIASVCKGTPSTMTGNGSVDGSNLVIPSPAYACDDGSEPKALSGPPLQDQLRNLTYVHDAQLGALSVGATSVWTREVAAAPSTDRSPSPSAAALVDFASGNPTPTFVSPINGYAFKYIDRGGFVPAVERWDPDDQAPIASNELYGAGAPYQAQFDVVETGFAAVFLSASTEIPDGVAIDAWVDASVAKYLKGDCHVPRSQQAAITIDGQLGRISECADEVVATVVADGRLYLFILAHSRQDARAFFDAFAATIRLTPETPYYFANVTRPFVSPINGYAFKYVDRGELVPATDRWDPATQPPSGRDKLNRNQFDEVETGFGAQFFSASTAIPDEASIDEWVDASVVKYLLGDCHAPRSEQAEIIIDGQSGRISECEDEVVATVVHDGRLYLFILYHDRTDARAFFDAFATTIDLTPETAAPGDVDGAGTSSPSDAP